MKKNDLYEIAIKILGLYLVTVLISQVQGLVMFIPAYVQQEDTLDRFNGNDQTPIFLALCFGFILLVIFTWILLFQTKQITQLIGEQHEEVESVELFAERKTVYEICLVLLGLITIVFTLPDLIVKLKNYVMLVHHESSVNPYDKTFLVTSGVKLVVGVLAILYSVQISTYLARPHQSLVKRDNE